MGYYNKTILAKFNAALRDAQKEVENGNDRVVISRSNSKMGAVASVSLLPFLTCPDRCKESCGEKCYAAKLANLRATVLKSYAVNTVLATKKPDVYWQAVDDACWQVRYFRFHVGGDIPNEDYLLHMIECARRHPETQMLAFTKRYELINHYIAAHGMLPTNLHILFSGWTNLTPDNPYRIAETNVIPHGGSPKEHWTLCGGNCFNCAKAGAGCWTATSGDVIAFPMH